VKLPEGEMVVEERKTKMTVTAKSINHLDVHMMVSWSDPTVGMSGPLG
jgi:hypothetical protein